MAGEFKEHVQIAMGARYNDDVRDGHTPYYFQLENKSVKTKKRMVMGTGHHPDLVRGRKLVDEMLQEMHDNWMRSGVAKATVDCDLLVNTEAAMAYAMAVMRTLGMESHISRSDVYHTYLVAYATKPPKYIGSSRKDVACGSDEPLPPDPSVEGGGDEEVRAKKRSRDA